MPARCKLHLAGGVACLLRPLEGFQCLVVILARSQRATEIKTGQRSLSVAEMLNCLTKVSQKELSDSQLQVPPLGRSAAGAAPASF